PGDSRPGFTSWLGFPRSSLLRLLRSRESLPSPVVGLSLPTGESPPERPLELPVPEKIVVTPTYNERGNIEKLLPDLLAFDPELEVVVVDDGSPDGTADAAEAIARERGRIHVVRRNAKEGIGPAYKAGFKRALELGA